MDFGGRFLSRLPWVGPTVLISAFHHALKPLVFHESDVFDLGPKGQIPESITLNSGRVNLRFSLDGNHHAGAILYAHGIHRVEDSSLVGHYFGLVANDSSGKSDSTVIPYKYDSYGTLRAPSCCFDPVYEKDSVLRYLSRTAPVISAFSHLVFFPNRNPPAILLVGLQKILVEAESRRKGVISKVESDPNQIQGSNRHYVFVDYALAIAKNM